MSAFTKTFTCRKDEQSFQVELFKSRTHQHIATAYAKSKCSFCNEVAAFVLVIEKIYYFSTQSYTKSCQKCIEHLFSLFPIKLAFYTAQLDFQIQSSDVDVEMKEILLERKAKLKTYESTFSIASNDVTSHKRRRLMPMPTLNGIQGLYLHQFHYAKLNTFEKCDFCEHVRDIVIFFMNGIKQRFCLECIQRMFQEEFPIQQTDIERMREAQNALFLVEKSRLDLQYARQMEHIEKLSSFVPSLKNTENETDF